MTWAELGFLSAGVFLGGVYAEIDGPIWGIGIFAAIVGALIGAVVTYWRRRFS